MSDESANLMEELIAWMQEMQWEVNAMRERLVEKKLVSEEHWALRMEDAKTEDLMRLRAEAKRRAVERTLRQRRVQ